MPATWEAEEGGWVEPSNLRYPRQQSKTLPVSSSIDNDKNNDG